jgi:hypothetical protein
MADEGGGAASGDSPSAGALVRSPKKSVSLPSKPAGLKGWGRRRVGVGDKVVEEPTDVGKFPGRGFAQWVEGREMSEGVGSGHQPVPDACFRYITVPFFSITSLLSLSLSLSLWSQ